MTIRRASLALSAALLAAAATPAAAQPTSVYCNGDKNPDCDDASNKIISDALDRFEATKGEEQVQAALALVDLAAIHRARLSEDFLFSLDTTLWIYFDDKDRHGGPAYKRVTDRMRDHAARAAAAKDGPTELFFLDWMASGLAPDERLGHARLVHRRAAELGLIRSGPAFGARVRLEMYGRDMLEEGRYAEVARALDDTFAELNDAGMETSDVWELQLRYAEALTLVRRDEDSDRAFDALMVMMEDPAYGDARRQFANNQISYYRNIAGRFAAAEAPGRIAMTEGERLDGREDIGTQKSRYNFALALLGQGKAAESLPYFEEALPLQLAVERGSSWVDTKTDTIILLTTLARARAQVKGREGDGLTAAVDAAERLRQRRDAGIGSSDANPAVAALAKAVARGTRRNPQSGAFDMVLFAGWAAREGGADALGPAFLAAQDLTLTDAGDAINEAAARDLAGTGPLGELVRQRQDTAQAVVSLTQRYRDLSLGKDEARAAALRAERDAAAARLAPLDARIAAEFPDYATLVTPKAIDVAAVQALLQPDEAVLMLLPSEGHHYAFAISKAAARWHRIDEGAAPVAADVARLKCRIDENTCSLPDYNALLEAQERGAPSPIDERYPRYDRAAAYRLYRQL
ncbi:hypothetical protein, partial [Sphingopyxis sp. HXXIV]